jgi:hypothetical protein
MLASLALGLLMFAHVMGLGVLSPDAAVWRNPPNDMSTMMAGYEAVVHEPWRFPPTVTSRLLAPEPISIVYTDSIPWLTLTLKLLGLGDAANPLGLFYLIAYLLQAAGMAWLASACGAKRPITLIAAAALGLLVPTWYVRQFGHVALSGHFIILFALALSATSARFGLSWRRVFGFCLLAALAAGVHAYHLLPVAAAFGAALLSEVLQDRPGAWKRSLLAAVLVLASLAASAVVLGYGLGQGRSNGGEVLGFWSMNLWGPFYPQASALAGQNWNGAWFPGAMDGTGGQEVAGYAYLGAGVLALLLLAALYALRVRPSRDAEAEPVPWPARWGPLFLAMLALFAIAVGPKIYFGHVRLAEIPTPRGALGDALGLYRAHGRFVWAVGYMAIAASLATLDRRARPLTLGVILALAAALQAYDGKELREGVHATYAYAAPAYSPAVLRTAPALEGRPWRIYPTYFCTDDLATLNASSELSLLAVRRGGSTNTAPTARPPRTGCDIPDGAKRASAASDETITAVLDRGDISSSLPAAFAGRGDCWRFRLGMICGRGLESLGLPHVDPAELALAGRVGAPDAVYRFDGRRPAILGPGWSPTEPTGTWSDGPQAEIVLPVPTAVPPTGSMMVQIEGLAYAPPPSDGQRVEVALDGKRLATWQVGGGPYGVYHVIIPRAAVQGETLRLSLGFPDARSPGAPDYRKLGMGVRRLTISH